jgi:hypothetical protein
MLPEWALAGILSKTAFYDQVTAQCGWTRQGLVWKSPFFAELGYEFLFNEPYAPELHLGISRGFHPLFCLFF